MHILVTAGNTQTPIDQVRCITNRFTGRTGAVIALAAQRRGHAVTLLTSHPEVLPDPYALGSGTGPPLEVRAYRTFAELRQLMEEHLDQRQAGRPYAAVVHCAAVGDYEVTGVFAGQSGLPQGPNLTAGKISSRHDELWIRLKPTLKLVDQIRAPWGFRGILVKFKLEVGLDAEELWTRAEAAREQSGADLVCANTLEGMADWALVGAGPQGSRIARANLADELLTRIETLAATRS